MQRVDLHLSEIAGWRALLTEAQMVAKLYLPESVEEYVLCLLYRTIGQPPRTEYDHSVGFLERLFQAHPNVVGDLRSIADQCLVFSGLFPEHAIRKRIPITYFVQLGQNAYLEHAARFKQAISRELGEHFVAIMDILQTTRELNSGEPCIDALNAYHLWRDAGSTHAWQVLRRLTPALPAQGDNTLRH